MKTYDLVLDSSHKQAMCNDECFTITLEKVAFSSICWGVRGTVQSLQKTTVCSLLPDEGESKKIRTVVIKRQQQIHIFTFCQFMESSNGLDWRNLIVHSVPNPFFDYGCHPIDQSAQNLIQPDLKHLQGWGIHTFSVSFPCVCCQTEILVGKDTSSLPKFNLKSSTPEYC